MLRLAAVFLVLSGVASLTFQVTWVRLIGLSLGATAAAVSSVLTAFFLGLSLGSYLAQRWLTRLRALLPVYLGLEAVIGVFGLLLLPVLLRLDHIAALAAPAGDAVWLKFLISVALLVVPTAAMGATFPVMAALVIRRSGEVGLRLSQLYSFNTLGAVLGAGLSGFVFIPRLGLNGAIILASCLNLGIVAIGSVFRWGFTGGLGDQVNRDHTSARTLQDTVGADSSTHAKILCVLFATGFVAVAAEVAWTKYLVIFVGTTIYGFSAILCIFLCGIAAGSWYARFRGRGLRSAHTSLAQGLLLLGLCLFLARAGLSYVPNVFYFLRNLEAAQAVDFAIKLAVVFVLIFPPTFVFGALFPISLRLYCEDFVGVRSRLGVAYAVNTLGSIAGSIAAAFYFIPRYGTDALLTWTALGVTFLPALFLPELRQRRKNRGLWPLVAAALFALTSLPHLDFEKLIASVGYDLVGRKGKDPKFLYLHESKTGVISVATYNGREVHFYNNGLNESAFNLRNPKRALLVESLLGYVPYFAHPKPKSAFVVGLGGGVTMRALLSARLDSVRVVELEPRMHQALLTVVGAAKAGLTDPRLRLDFTDARYALRVTRDRYDILVSQPSHPWRAGAANLFTEEFFELARSRLLPAGIYGQWLNLFRMDTETLRAIMRSFLTVFPHALSMIDPRGDDLLMFGSTEPIKFDWEKVQARLDEGPVKEVLAPLKVKRPEHLLAMIALTRSDMLRATGAGPHNTDTNILSEVRLARAQEFNSKEVLKFLKGFTSFDVGTYLGPNTLTPEAKAAHLLKVADQLMSEGRYSEAKKLAESARHLDPDPGNLCLYRIAWAQSDAEQALSLYAQRKRWPDDVHIQQAQLQTSLMHYDEAERIVKRISKRSERRLQWARLANARGAWKQLADMQAENATERAYQLTALARKDILEAGRELLELPASATSEIPHQYVKLGYFAATQQFDSFDRTLQKLSRLKSREAAFLQRFARTARANGDRALARKLSQRALSLDAKSGSKNKRKRKRKQ